MSDNSQNDETPLTPEQQENDFISILGEKNFDKAKYRLDVQKLQNIGMPLDILNPMAYKKDDDNDNDNDKNKNKTQETLTSRTIKATAFHSFRKKKRKLFGRGSNGETFEAKNYEELNKLIAGSYKKENEKTPRQRKKTASSNIILPIKIPKRWPLSQKLSLMRVLPSAEMFLKIPNSGKI